MICVAITSTKKKLPILVNIGNKNGLNDDSVANCSQIRSLDKTRLIHKIGTCSEEVMQQVDEALRISLAL